MRLVVGIDDKVAATGLVVGRSEPIHNEIDDLRTKMEAFILQVNAQLSKQDGRIINKTLLMMYLAANLLLACIGQALGTKFF